MSQRQYSNGYVQNNLNVAVVGGGLVGALAALHLGKRGYDVNVYEFREDIRTAELVVGRSINLALSMRGRKALAEVGLEGELLKHGLPMKGRMLHDLKGNLKAVMYDNNTHQTIFSVGRKHLNEVLLNEAEKYPNIHLNFKHRLTNADLDEGKLHFVNPETNETKEVDPNLIIGCDGAYSAIRKEYMKRSAFDYSQNYIEHGYLELCIPPKDGEFQMAHEYLHIWPRGEFMMIALPNQDKTWTVTLFMPFKNFDSIITPDDLLEFFKTYFPDSIDLIGRDRLIKDFFRIKAQPLISVKCKPYHVNDNVLLMGDAAHAMVPFYGQGMNCGFEDCSVLTSLLNKYGNDMQKILSEYSNIRWENAHAVVDLAMYNYIEMRYLCATRKFLMRKKLDEFLYWLMPKVWVPLYNSVSFTHIEYKDCIKNKKWQDDILSRVMKSTGFVICFSLTIYGYHKAMEQNVISNVTSLFQKYLTW